MDTKHELSGLRSDMSSQLERLVSGELADPDRRSVIAWLDEEPGRWRLCGLLFLEAQTWSQALAEWPTNGESARPVAVSAVADSSKESSRRPRLRDMAVLAASVLSAFLLGAATRHGGGADRGALKMAVTDSVPIDSSTASAQGGDTRHGDVPIMAKLPVASKGGIPFQPAVHVAVVKRGTSQSHRESSTSVPSIPDYVRQQWARRGYELDVERRFLLATLPSGEQVAVPFEQFAIKPLPLKIN
jgi:hypothetical protein